MTRAASSAWRAVRNTLLILLTIVVVAATTQALWLAPLVSYELTRRSGRDAHVDTMWIGLSSALAPVVHLRGIRIANAPWAEAGRPFVALASATAVFSWKSIEQRRPVVALWTLADGEVDLERTADGLRNWRLTNPQYRGPGRWKVLAVRGERAKVRFVHGGLDLELDAISSAAPTAADTGSEPQRPTRLDLQGRWRELPFAVSADTGPVLTFFETGETFPIRGRMDVGGARLDIEGQVGDIVRRPIADAHVVLTAPSLTPFAAFVSSRHKGRAIRIEAAMKAGDGHYALSGLKARVGATDIAGDASWAHDEDENVLRATLESDSTDVADLRWLAGLRAVRAHAAAPDTAASGAAANVGASSSPAMRRAARDTDAELSFVARRLRSAELPALQSGRVEAKVSDGRLTVASFDIGVAQGHVTGSGSLGLRDAPMRAEADVRARGVRIESFIRDAEGRSRLTGAVEGHALLKTHGDAPDALRDNVTGRITASIGSGTISSRLDAEIGLQVGKIVRSFLAGTEPVAIKCAAATIDLERGTGRLSSLVFDTERTRTTGRGTIDLATETVDVVLTPQAKQGGMFDLERSIRLHGPIRHPGRELVARAPVPSPSNGACARP